MSHGVFLANIEGETLDNHAFRRVLFTSHHQQLVVMSLRPLEDIGSEVHPTTDQFIRVEKGHGRVVFWDNDRGEFVALPLQDGTAIVVPAGTWHNIINTSKRSALKLYTLYSPPHHAVDAYEEDKPLGEL